MLLGDVLQAYMDREGYTVRVFAATIGVHYATLHRLLKGKPYDSKTLAKVMLWLIG